MKYLFILYNSLCLCSYVYRFIVRYRWYNIRSRKWSFNRANSQRTHHKMEQFKVNISSTLQRNTTASIYTSENSRFISSNWKWFNSVANIIIITVRNLILIHIVLRLTMKERKIHFDKEKGDNFNWLEKELSKYIGRKYCTISFQCFLCN